MAVEHKHLRLNDVTDEAGNLAVVAQSCIFGSFLGLVGALLQDGEDLTHAVVVTLEASAAAADRLKRGHAQNRKQSRLANAGRHGLCAALEAGDEAFEFGVQREGEVELDAIGAGDEPSGGGDEREVAAGEAMGAPVKSGDGFAASGARTGGTAGVVAID